MKVEASSTNSITETHGAEGQDPHPCLALASNTLSIDESLSEEGTPRDGGNAIYVAIYVAI